LLAKPTFPSLTRGEEKINKKNNPEIGLLIKKIVFSLELFEFDTAGFFFGIFNLPFNPLL